MSLNALLLMKCAFRVNEVNDFIGSGILILELECLWTCHFSAFHSGEQQGSISCLSTEHCCPVLLNNADDIVR